MKPVLILLAALVIGGLVVRLIDRVFYGKYQPENTDEIEENAVDEAPASGCADEGCGLRPVCPSEQILAGECKTEVIYYDDEELDAFAGRAGDGYTADEEEQWRDVLYTLRPEDLIGWGQSVKHRGLVMPDAIRAEFLLLAGEHHTPSGQ